ncbi:MerR family transcriptional regulator [Nonlabens ponticola]|uniref:MerR family transcriptional regulator n=1 Tax=Nonlabens ponticola TaxID=2496866 RepID=A0A3S9N0E3_9FLAO|nr:MerR family transcriptional regulator [Nonlabens ponticola]AZQ44890.1 MerR family transcriptional regulator [Nonlabens ponticola]
MIKNTFSIKDLENLSGIKAHTIRIWEKRYNLLEPNRTDTNIRNYDVEALQKILNVSYLKNSGIKISAIAALSGEEIEKEVRRLAQNDNRLNFSIQQVKMAMVNFDNALFQETYKKLFQQKGFSGVFKELFIPFLIELGFLWQSKTINIAHEHYISHLIKQKLLANLEEVQYSRAEEGSQLYVLFLPENEMHDLGLLFLNYELLSRGHNTIYLGASMTLDNLSYFQKRHDKPIYITYLTVNPEIKKIPTFLDRFNKKVACDTDIELWLLGHLSEKIDADILNDNQKRFDSISELIDHIS